MGAPNPFKTANLGVGWWRIGLVTGSRTCWGDMAPALKGLGAGSETLEGCSRVLALRIWGTPGLMIGGVLLDWVKVFASQRLWMSTGRLGGGWAGKQAGGGGEEGIQI